MTLSLNSTLIENIRWHPVHGATTKVDENGYLVLADTAKSDWNLLRWTDPRLNGVRVKLTVQFQPAENCRTCFYVHHWGSKDVCAINKDGTVVLDDCAESIRIEKLANGFFSATVIFLNHHSTLSFGTGNPRGYYEGNGADQYVFRSIEVELESISPIRQMMIERLWKGVDPFHAFPDNLIEHDLQGWNSQHPYLAGTIESHRPSLIVEIGVWKGGSTIFMANELKKRGLPSLVIAVDTWLGSSEHWLGPSSASLSILYGHPSLFYKFLSNVIREQVVGLVLPLPMDSLNAAEVLKSLNVAPTMIHLDGGHDYESVIADLRVWWPLLAPGGVFVGDDYYLNDTFPGLRRAFDEFFGRLGLTPIEQKDGKCRITKSGKNHTVSGNDH